MNTTWFKQLKQLKSPTGEEKAMASWLKKILKPMADDVFEDALGNVYAVKNPRGATSKVKETIMLSAHMDEPSFTVIDIDDGGFLRIEGIGVWHAVNLIGARLLFARTQTIGVVGVEPHVELADVAFRHLFVDIAAKNRQDAEQRIAVGDLATVHGAVETMTPDVFVGPVLSNRISCAVLLEVLQKANNQSKIVAAFTVQKQVGSRGARVASYRVDPDLAVVIDVTKAGDTPHAERPSLALGQGPAIKMLDASMVVAPVVRERLIDCANKAGVTYQREVSPATTSDANALFVGRGGIPTGGVSIVTRQASYYSNMVHVSDLANAVTLLITLVE